MSKADDIIDLIDAGLGRIQGALVPIRADRCGRADCHNPLAAGHDFCQPCLDWLRGDGPDPNPLPDVDAPNEEPVDAIVAWVELHGGLP